MIEFGLKKVEGVCFDPVLKCLTEMEIESLQKSRQRILKGHNVCLYESIARYQESLEGSVNK